MHEEDFTLLQCHVTYLPSSSVLLSRDCDFCLLRPRRIRFRTVRIESFFSLHGGLSEARIAAASALALLLSVAVLVVLALGWAFELGVVVSSVVILPLRPVVGDLPNLSNFSSIL